MCIKVKSSGQDDDLSIIVMGRSEVRSASQSQDDNGSLLIPSEEDGYPGYCRQKSGFNIINRIKPPPPPPLASRPKSLMSKSFIYVRR